MFATLIVLALAAVLFLFQWVLRRGGLWVAIAVYFVLPAACTAYWLRANDFGLFPWIKVYTVLFCACYGSVLRYTSLGERRVARWGIIVLLALNILEAVIVDVIEGGLANVVNAVAGLVLVVTLPRSADAVRVVRAEYRDLHLGVSRTWVVGYTVWNWAFVYLNYPQYTGHHIAVLSAALVVGAVDPRRWVQARAYTLGAYFIAITTFGPHMMELLDTSDWNVPGMGLGAAVLALLTATACVRFTIPTRTPRRCACVVRSGAVS